MGRSELTLAIAGALAVAVLLGWVLGWMFSRLNGPSGPRSIRRTSDMAARLHDAEEAAAKAEARLASVEADLAERLAEVRGELETAYQHLAREQARTEEIREAYRAAMSGLTRGG
jgi:hypothetical protein